MNPGLLSQLRILLRCALSAVLVFAVLGRGPARAEERFSATGSMTPPLITHAAERLLDGRVLVSGGFPPASTVSAGAQLFDPQTGSWSATGSINTARYYHMMARLADGRVLAAGGFGLGGASLTSAELYDPATGLWTDTGSMDASRQLGDAVVLPSGEVLIAGHPGSAVQIYHPATGEWRTVGNLFVGDTGICSVLLPNGRVLVMSDDESQEFDPVAEMWGNTATTPTEDGRRAVLLTNGKVLRIGGGNARNSAEIYDPVTTSWEATDSLSQGRTFFTATVLADGRVLVTGGTDLSAHSLASAEIYDPALGTWSDLPPMTALRSKHTATTLANGDVLLAGGGPAGAAELFVSRVAGSLVEEFVPPQLSAVTHGNFAVTVFATAFQADGKIIIVGNFTSANGAPRQRIARLHADGTLDETFNPGANDNVHCVAVQPDGKIIIGGEFSFVGGEGRDQLARLHADGSVDDAFPLYAHGRGVRSVALQPDGKIIVGTASAGFNSSARLLRYEADCSRDPSLEVSVPGESVRSVLVQPDGKIVYGGLGLARVNADGTPDASFAPMSNIVLGLARQPDGKIIVLGYDGIDRFNEDGSVDAGFQKPMTDGGAWGFCAAVQTDGRIIVGGEFSQLNGEPRGRIARLLPNGEVDDTFEAGAAHGIVYSVAVRGDGRVMSAGSFTNAGGLPRSRVAQFFNDNVVQTLRVVGGGRNPSLIEWLRSGASGEVEDATFAWSIDGGATWKPLARPVRVEGGWRLGNLPLAGFRGLLRAQGFHFGSMGASSGLIQQVEPFDADYFTVAPTLSPIGVGGVTKSPVTVSFTLPEPAAPGSVKLYLNPTTFTLAASLETEGLHTFSFDPANPAASPAIASGGSPLADGTYLVVLSYMDAVSNNPASAQQTVRIDTTITAGGTFSPLTLISGALPDYRAQITGDGSEPITVGAQTPAPGTMVSEGNQPVSIEVHDDLGNSTTVNFNVTVRPLHPVTVVSLVAGQEGDEVPGAGTGSVPADAKLASFGVPAIDDAGDLAFTAKWLSETSGKGSGLFLNDDCLGVVGGVAPGVTGATFKSFADPVVDEGSVAVIAALAGVRTTPSAVFSNLNGSTVLDGVARAGAVAPGFDGIAPVDGAKFKAFKAVAIDDGHIAIFAQLTGGTGAEKATAASDLGLWLKDGTSALRLALREGGTVEVEPGDTRTIKTLVSFAPGHGSPGQGRGWLSQPYGPAVLALVTFTDRSQAVVSAGGGGGTFIFSRTGLLGTGGPLLPGATFASYSFPAMNDGYTAAFLASMKPGGLSGVTKANARGIFRSDGAGKYVALARVSRSAGETGRTFSVLKDPVLASDDSLAFPATITGGGATLWWQPAGGDLTLLAQSGAVNGGVENDLPGGAQWKAFTSLALAANRGPVFAATLVPGQGGVLKTTASGVWAMDLDRKLRTLFRTGATDIVPNKTLKSFTLLNATVGSTGVTRSLNATQKVAWLATFTDKSQAIVTTEVP